MQLVVSLKYIHASNVLHRDMKTQNVLMGGAQNRVVKVADFGIAKVLSEDAMAETIVGTPHYLSPELCQGQKYNMKSDMWALGCILYELCALSKPFDASNMPAIIFAIMRNQPRSIPKEYSSDMKDVVASLLQPSPADRPSAADIFELPAVQKHWRKWSKEQDRLQRGSKAPSAPQRTLSPRSASVAAAITGLAVPSSTDDITGPTPPATPAAQRAALQAKVSEIEERTLNEAADARSLAKNQHTADGRVALAARLRQIEGELRDTKEGRLVSGAVWEAVGQAWGETGNFDAAISAYRAALGAKNANASLTAMEQLGNLLVRRAQQIWAQAKAGNVKAAAAAASAFTAVAALGVLVRRRERLRQAHIADSGEGVDTGGARGPSKSFGPGKGSTAAGEGGEPSISMMSDTGASIPGEADEWRAGAAAMMAEGLGLLERLVGFGPTAERHSLLGSAYKRRAWTGLGTSRKADLRAAAEAYSTAHDFEMQHRAEDTLYIPSPYARLNQLTFELLASARQGQHKRLCKHILQAQGWADERKEQDPTDVWLWVQIADAKALRWLSGCDGVIQAQVVATYREQFAIGASERVKSSVLDQLAFMSEVLLGRLKEEEARRNTQAIHGGPMGVTPTSPTFPSGGPTGDGAWSVVDDVGTNATGGTGAASSGAGDNTADAERSHSSVSVGSGMGSLALDRVADASARSASRPGTADTLASARIAPDTVIAWLTALERRVRSLRDHLSGAKGDVPPEEPPRAPVSGGPSKRTLQAVSRAGGQLLDTLHSVGGVSEAEEGAHSFVARDSEPPVRAFSEPAEHELPPHSGTHGSAELPPGVPNLASIGSDTFRAAQMMPVPSGLSTIDSMGRGGTMSPGGSSLASGSGSGSGSRVNPFARSSAKPFTHARGGGTGPAAGSKAQGSVHQATGRARRSVVPVVPAGVNPFGRAAKRYRARPSGGKEVKGGVGDATLRAEDIHKVKRVTSGELDNITSQRRPLSGELSPQSSSNENLSSAGRSGRSPASLANERPSVETETGPSEPGRWGTPPFGLQDSPSRGAVRDNTNTTAGDVRMRLSSAGMNGSEGGGGSGEDGHIVGLHHPSDSSSGNSARNTPTKLPHSPRDPPPDGVVMTPTSARGHGSPASPRPQPMLVKPKGSACCSIM